MDIYKNSNLIDPRPLIEPGVLQVVCEKTGRSFFLECENVLKETGQIYSNIVNNKYKNAQLLQDYQIFGWEAFSVIVVGAGEVYGDPEKRHALLINAQDTWEGELY